ncbi:hypothetical protein GQ457_05G021970 [Hibiscus cannabinus]
MTSTVHVRMTGTAEHVVALDAGWQLPTWGWTKVNVDGNCEWMLGHAICGGAWKPSYGEFMLVSGAILTKGFEK